MVMVASKDGSRAERSDCQIKFDDSIFWPSLAKELLENRLSFLFFPFQCWTPRTGTIFPEGIIERLCLYDVIPERMQMVLSRRGCKPYMTAMAYSDQRVPTREHSK